jgi:hypothetical protein
MLLSERWLGWCTAHSCLPRAVAHAATKRALVAKQRPPHWMPPSIFQNDTQFQIVMTAAAELPPEKCSVFLESLGAMLNMREGRFTDADLIEIAALARTGLIREPA